MQSHPHWQASPHGMARHAGAQHTQRAAGYPPTWQQHAPPPLNLVSWHTPTQFRKMGEYNHNNTGMQTPTQHRNTQARTPQGYQPTSGLQTPTQNRNQSPHTNAFANSPAFHAHRPGYCDALLLGMT